MNCTELEWNWVDRAAWAEYRKLEDKQFPINPRRPLSDPPGMAAARRKFEKQQRVAKAKWMLGVMEL